MYPTAEQLAAEREWNRKKEITCTGCGQERDDVEQRYSFGYYAGRMCEECAYTKYRDHCGLGGRMGDPTELDEFEYGGYPAIEGEEDY